MPRPARRAPTGRGGLARVRALRVLAARLAVGLGLGAALPQAALAPASAHDRVASRTEAEIAPPPAWRGIGLPEETPSTAALIAADLADLAGGTDPRPAGAGPAEIVRFGDVAISRALVETILRAAEETGADPVYLMALADKESSFVTRAKASTSSAEGLFQFLDQTWFEMVRTFGARHGLAAEAAAIVADKGGQLTVSDAALRDYVLDLRRDAYTAAVMAGEMTKRDRARVEQRLGRELKRSECYLAHFLGAASAGRFMQLADGKPTQSAAAAFRAAARSNRSLFFAKAGKKTRHLTVAEVYLRLDDMIDRRLDRFQGVTGLAVGASAAASGLPLDPSLVFTP